MDFLFLESLLYTSIPLGRNVRPVLRRLILVDTLRRVHNVGFLVERLISVFVKIRRLILMVCFFYFMIYISHIMPCSIKPEIIRLKRAVFITLPLVRVANDVLDQ